jgi:hypothetical protein
MWDGRTDARTDRLITIGHPPYGGALTSFKLENMFIIEITTFFFFIDIRNLDKQKILVANQAS